MKLLKNTMDISVQQNLANIMIMPHYLLGSFTITITLNLMNSFDNY